MFGAGGSDDIGKSNDRRPFKSGISSSQNRRQRNDTTVQIRKSRRAEGIARRRVIAHHPATASGATQISHCMNSDGMNDFSLPPLLRKIFQNVHLPDTVIRLLTKREMKFNDDIAFSSSVGTNLETLVQECGCVPILISALKNVSTNANNLGSMEATGANNSENEVRGQSALCLGNIAGEAPALRDYVLKCNAMNALLENIPKIIDNDANSIMNTNDGTIAIQVNMDESFLEKIVWSISNLCRGRTKSIPESLSIAIPHLFYLAQKSTGDVQLNACWALAYMTDGSDELILRSIVKTDVLSLITSFLNRHVYANPSLVLSTLRILCNFVYGLGKVNFIAFLDHLLTPDQLENISHLLRTSTKDVQMEACFLLSNIVEIGSESNISILIQSQSLIRTLMDLIRNAHQSLKIEAIWTIWGIVEVAREEEVRVLVEQFEIIPTLFWHQMNLEFLDSKIIIMLLDTLDTILLVGERLGHDYRTLVNECGGIDVIEGLQTHTSDEVYRRAVEIMDAHFGGDDDDSEEQDYYSSFQ